MFRTLAVLSLLGWQDPAPSPRPADPPSVKAQVDAAEADALARYNEQTQKIPDTAAAHWKLGLWCEQHKLRPEAYTQFGRVIELDPRRDLAWQKLGFKRHEGRWMTAEQITAEEKQDALDKTWTANLKKWHRAIHGGKEPAEAQAELDKVTDPVAAPAIFREFAAGGGADQSIAVQLLGQVRSPIASKGLALLALYGKTPAVRRAAMETLRQLPPEEFLDLLVALMKDPLRYEVRPVGGPGSPGVLYIEGDDANFRRFYAPPPMPSITPRFGDTIAYDMNGMPVVFRSQSHTVKGQVQGVPGSKTLVSETDKTTTTTETFTFYDAMAEAQRAAQYAQGQLQGDIAKVEGMNRDRKRFTDLVIEVARGATGKNLGASAKEWRAALDTLKSPRYAKRPRERPKPTVGEVVPLDYVPQFVADMQIQSQNRSLTRTYVDT